MSEDAPMCRFCLSEDLRINLISPCSCKGGSKWIHRACLDEWRIQGADRTCFQQCSECLTPYKIKAKASFFNNRTSKRRVMVYILRDIVILSFAITLFTYIFGVMIYYVDEMYSGCYTFCQPTEEIRPEGFIGPICHDCRPIQGYFAIACSYSFAELYFRLSVAVLTTSAGIAFMAYNFIMFLISPSPAIYSTRLFANDGERALRFIGTFIILWMFCKTIAKIIEKHATKLGFRVAAEDLLVVDLEDPNEDVSYSAVDQQTIDAVLADVSFWKRFV